MKSNVKFLLVLLLLVFTACSNNTNNNVSNNSDDSKVTIGIVQFAKHEALDNATNGFKQALADNGFDSSKVELIEKNANGEQSNATTIANQFVNDKVDLIFANATPAAQSCANATSEIPILITSVTDPESAGLVKSNSNPGNNVTGTSDLTPVEAQIELLLEILPDVKNVAVMINGSEDNSRFQADIALNVLKDKNLNGIETTVSDLASIQSVVESLIGKVEAIYIPTDNMLAEGMSTISMVANANKIPVIVGEEGMVNNGGLATTGINYYNLGYKTGEMAVKVLNGENPGNMAIEYLPAEACEKVVNLASAKELNLTLSDTVLEGAKTVE